ncbi:MAG TPA: carboxypeptidase-like regulatory domain-containing protein, partial [Verrucomicrobiae bacterium]
MPDNHDDLPEAGIWHSSALDARILRNKGFTRMRPFQSIILLTLLVFGAGTTLAQSPDRELHGQLLNASGQPVPGAIVRVRAVSRTSGTRYGETDDVDPTVKTDAKGEFIIRGKNPFLAATFTAEAPGYAKGVFTELTTGLEAHALTMFEGVSVIGVITKDGAPVANVKVGICDTDRGSRIFTVDLNATTDAQGRFRITNVPPKRDYYLFGFMHSFADKGALPSRRITAAGDGTVLDLGELKVEPAYVLDGHLSIQLPHIPILLSRYRGRDAQTTETGALGQFHFAGVPGEVMTLSVDSPGQRLSLDNASLNPADPTHLVGRIITNKTDLLIDLEQGAPLDPLNMSGVAAAEEPLRGAEPPTAGPNTIKVTGNVLDAETGEKISPVVTSEGRVNQRDYDWFFTRTHHHPTGDFTTY